jgi:hypothetical protein
MLRGSLSLYIYIYTIHEGEMYLNNYASRVRVTEDTALPLVRRFILGPLDMELGRRHSTPHGRATASELVDRGYLSRRRWNHLPSFLRVLPASLSAALRERQAVVVVAVVVVAVVVVAVVVVVALDRHDPPKRGFSRGGFIPWFNRARASATSRCCSAYLTAMAGSAVGTGVP